MAETCAKTSSIGALTSLSDIQQVAVLKGPQGTLFGRNATGGLIQITTKPPSYDFTGDVQATAGNYGTYGGSAYVSGGLSQNTAGSIAFKYEDRQDGLGVNTYTGNDVLDQETYFSNSAPAISAPTECSPYRVRMG